MSDPERRPKRSGDGHREFSGKQQGWRLLGASVGMAVVAVLLASGLLQAGARWREKARRASCHSNVKQFGVALAQYAGDFDGRCPWREGSLDPRDAWCDLGMLCRAYPVAGHCYFCPSSDDQPFHIVVPENARKTRSLAKFAPGYSMSTISYSYGFDARHRGPWIGTMDPGKPTLRLLADKKAGVTATGYGLRKAGHRAKGRNVLFADGRAVWTDGTAALDPDPGSDVVGPPHAPDYTDWWSDPPYYGE